MNRQQYMPDGQPVQRTVTQVHIIPVQVQHARHAKPIITVRVAISQPTVAPQKVWKAVQKTGYHPVNLNQPRHVTKQVWIIPQHMGLGRKCVIGIQTPDRTVQNAKISKLICAMQGIG